MNRLKILYALQAIGNGHISRAIELIPQLQKVADVTVLVSGTSSELRLPFAIDYQFEGISFTFGKKGGIDFYQTFKKLNSKAFLKAIYHLPVHEFDLVVSDFEPISAWACKLKGKKCIGISNQEALKHADVPKPAHKDWIGEFFIHFFAPTSIGYGFHFLPLTKNVFPPLIRSTIRQLQPEEKNHYTIYLPAYDDKQILKLCKYFFYIDWQIFSKHTNKAYRCENAYVSPINNEKFVESLRTCKGFVCGAGFEAPAEALYLGKKLLVVPMQNQYEQHYNAAGLAALGVSVLKKLKPKYYDVVENWLKQEEAIQIEYEPSASNLVQTILSHTPQHQDERRYVYSSLEYKF